MSIITQRVPYYAMVSYCRKVCNLNFYETLRKEVGLSYALQ